MANTKRTKKEIEMDCKRLKEAAKTKTWKEKLVYLML